MRTTMGAIILAGGQSRRMGTNKALLRLAPAGPTLIELVVAAARQVADPLILSTNTPTAYHWLGLQCVGDQLGAGPLAGLAAGLAALTTPGAFLLACDLPGVRPALLHLLAEIAERDPTLDAIVPLDAADRPQSVVALYRGTCLAAIQRQLAAGQLQMTAWYDQVHTRYVTAATVREVDPDLRSFHNVNTPEDLAESRWRWGRAEGGWSAPTGGAGADRYD